MKSFLSIALSLAPVVALADVTLPPLISDNMLLQQPKAAIWGEADPGEKVTVSFGKSTASTTAGAEGKWRVELDGLTAGDTQELSVEGKNKIVVKNVAVGEVWVASGQSNMEWPVSKSLDAEKEIQAANHPEIRMFTVRRERTATPMEIVKGQWKVCTPETVGNWSAVGYYFARSLQQEIQRPIGIIHTSWGGTRAQPWTPQSALAADPVLVEKYLIPWQKHLENLPALRAAHQSEMAAWASKAEAAKAAGKPVPVKPRGPEEPTGYNALSALYNGMVHGATPYSIKGFIWYQGESNVAEAATYQRLLSALIASWRKEWKSGDLPFLIVQISNLYQRNEQPTDHPWARLREAQRLTSIAVPNTALAVTLDIGEADNVHPKNKQEVGRRLALLAAASTYGKKIVSSGPFFEKAQFDGDKVIVSFKAGTADGLRTTDGAPVKGFAIAGEDRRFVWAEARIEAGDSSTEPVVVVSSSNIAKPAAIRYAWAANPEINLVNKDSLPASPFRTDDWPEAK